MLRFSRPIMAAVVLAASSIAAACGSSVSDESGGTEGAGGATSATTGSTGTAAGAGGNPCFPDSCSGPSTGPGTASTGSGAGGGSTGGICGGLAGIACGPDEFCDFPADDCGGYDGAGVCTPRPEGCPDIYQPTCGCDGMVYGNPCDANAAGVDPSNTGECPPPEGAFSCGPTFCLQGMHYCQRAVSDVVGVPDGYSCVDLPEPCLATGDPTCDCLASEPCGQACEESAAGDFTLVCPGG